MNFSELATILRNTCDRAPSGEKVVSIHLFGIRYAGELDGISLRDLVEAAGINAPYATEIRKGMNLAAYVTLR